MRRLIMALAILMVVGAQQFSLAESEHDRALLSVALVEKAVAFVQEKGADYACKVFSCSRGPFVDRELYVFALSLDNVMLAHPWKHGLVGKNLDDFQDPKGKLLFREFKTVVQSRGAGWVDYWWWIPGGAEQVPKRSYVRKVPGTQLYVGAGYYPKESIKSRAVKTEAKQTM